MSIYKPYTYLIGWTKYNKWYYGCQYGKKAHPSNLWKTYFTSSKEVRLFCEEYGDPDVIEIRKTFDDALRTRLNEIKVIRRMGIVQDSRFLNQRNPGGLETFIRKIAVPWNKGKVGLQKSPYKGITGRYSEEERLLISERTKEAMNNLSDDSRNRMCEAHRNCENKLWIHDNTGTHKRIRQEQLDDYILLGWHRGRKMSRDPISGKFAKS